MKGTKTSLFLIELMIALLLFAFCAAICVQIFHASNKRTESAEDLSKAVFQATTVAELYKSVGGDLESLQSKFDELTTLLSGNTLTLYFDEDWNLTMMPMLSSTFPPPPGYSVSIIDNGGTADITVFMGGAKIYDSAISYETEDIFKITVKAVAS